MKTEQVISYYVTQTAVAKALDISQGCVSRWKEYPPDLRQLQIEAHTGGALKAEKTILQRKTKK